MKGCSTNLEKQKRQSHDCLKRWMMSFHLNGSMGGAFFGLEEWVYLGGGLYGFKRPNESIPVLKPLERKHTIQYNTIFV